jgi:hypothetical protein
MIHTFLPVLHKIKDPVVVEIHSITLQPAVHSFLNCIIILVVLGSHMFFQGPKWW